jgi:hypothetical protein
MEKKRAPEDLKKIREVFEKGVAEGNAEFEAAPKKFGPEEGVHDCDDDDVLKK